MTPNRNGTTMDGTMVAKKRTFVGLGVLAGLILVGLLACAAPVAATEYGWGIQVWSTPPNAYVSIDPVNGGMGYGGWTDGYGSATFSSLPAYTWYRVTVSKDGYQPLTQSVYVDMDNTKVVSADLRPW